MTFLFEFFMLLVSLALLHFPLELSLHQHTSTAKYCCCALVRIRKEENENLDRLLIFQLISDSRRSLCCAIFSEHFASFLNSMKMKTFLVEQQSVSKKGESCM